MCSKDHVSGRFYLCSHQFDVISKNVDLSESTLQQQW